MSVLLKLLPAAAIGLVAYANSDELKKSLNIISKVQVAATSGIEMQGIAEAVAQEYTSEGTLPLDDFGKFLRENMREKGGKTSRDRDKDPWGTAYRIAVKGEGFEIQSAGLDTKWNTEDDLKYFYSLKELGGAGAAAEAAAKSKSGGSSAGATGSSAATRRAPANTASKWVPPTPEEVKKKVLESQITRAAAGSPLAQYELGLRYLTGDGVEKDERIARHWLEESSKNGNADATRRLEALGAAKP